MERKFNFGAVNWKWIAYAAELYALFIIQYTPGMMPQINGTGPNLLMICALSIAIFEGDKAGLYYGAAAGLLMDYSGTRVFGFNGLFVAVICYFCGILITDLMRNNLLTAILLSLCSMFVFGVIRWLFFNVLWGYPELWYEFYGVMLVSVLYSAFLMAPVYLFTKVIATSLGQRK
ncbi:MAG: rod shape-determining protein MreD [Clostridia bacterium]|nr:rod shape-determining protein MreD [Clostridia bacterium]